MSVRDDLRRYAQLISGMIPGAIPFAPSCESATAVQVERGTILPVCLSGNVSTSDAERVERLIELARSARLPGVAVVDRADQHRPAYRGLLVYAWAQAYRLVYETLPRQEFGRWEEGVRAWCDVLESELTRIELPGGAIPATFGAAAGEAAWAALALWVAGKVFIRDAWTDLAADTFGRLTRPQQPSGALLVAGASDNLESYWYHELVILHAAASFAVQSEDRTVAAAVARATEYHLRETQPDHATQQAWGVFAFVWNEGTRSVADQILHGVRVGQPEGVTGVDAILLADVVYCLGLFEKPVVR